MLAQASEQHGLTLRLGFELEFYLLHKPEHNRAASGGSSGIIGGSGGSSAPVPARLPQPIDSSNYCSSSAFDAAAPGDLVSRQLVSTQGWGITHHSCGAGRLVGCSGLARLAVACLSGSTSQL